VGGSSPSGRAIKTKNVTLVVAFFGFSGVSALGEKLHRFDPRSAQRDDKRVLKIVDSRTR
ncbi:MAG: hypothetical protein AAF431_18110, partial [Pseudomonadota bacterium]